MVDTSSPEIPHGGKMCCIYVENGLAYGLLLLLHSQPCLAGKQMNILFFVKFQHVSHELSRQVVMLVTADSVDLAEHNAWNQITLEYRNQFMIQEVTRVCETPDSVICFEPV